MKRKGVEMHVHRQIAASLVAAALIAPAAAQAVVSPDDRPFYRGGSDDLAPGSVSPDDRSFSRSVTVIAPASPPVEVVASATGFDWGDAAIGSTFGAALVLLLAGGAAVVVTQRRRPLRSA